MTNHLRNLTLSTLAFALAPLAQANAVTIFDSSHNAWTSTSSVSSTNGATTTIGPSSGNIPSPQSDVFNLPTPITTNSGVWTLTATIDQLGANPANQVWAGLGNAVPWNNGTALQNGPLISGSSTYYQGAQTASGIGSQGQGYYTVTSIQSGNGGLVDSGHNVPVTPNQMTAFDGPTSQSTPTTFQLTLNTNAPNWTLQYSINGVVQQYTDTVTNQVLNQLTYATDPTGINQLVIGTYASTGDFNVTLTDVTAAVPEPSTWAMMVLGFAGLGFLAYRRKDRKGGLNFRLV